MWTWPLFEYTGAMVTGGDSGIGYEAVHMLMRECACVMMVGHDHAKTVAAFQTLSSVSHESNCSRPWSRRLGYISIDVTHDAEVEMALNKTVSLCGRLDVGINNAGGRSASPVQVGHRSFIDSFDKSVALDVNLKGTILCMQVQVHHWRQMRAPGVIVNMASIKGLTGWGDTPLYTASKWAIIGISKQVALQNAKYRIRVNVLAPGNVDTPLLRLGRVPWPSYEAAIGSAVPLGRLAQAQEMSGPIAFLASEMSSFVTGQVLVADGGSIEDTPYKPTTFSHHVSTKQLQHVSSTSTFASVSAALGIVVCFVITRSRTSMRSLL